MSAEGPILADLKAIVSKVVNPLASRLLHDFPLVKKGFLYPVNIEAMAIGVGCGDIWKSYYETRVRDAFEKRDKIKNSIKMVDIKIKLDKLYKWVGKTARGDSHIPWDASDKSILENIPEN